MKNRHIATALIVLSLLAVTFLATAKAEVYYNSMSGIKAGKDYTFTIDTSVAATLGGEEITNFGLYVDTATVSMTVYNNKGVAIVIDLDWTDISVNPDGTSIVIRLVKQDGLPSRGSAINVQGDLTGPYDGNTFFATGPGWGWGGHY